MGGKLKGSFDLVFRPSLDLISVVRRFVHEFYQEILHVEAGSQLALATHELLENAVKYGVDGETRLSIDVTEDAGALHVAVRTVNNADGAHIARIKELFGEMEKHPDPFDFYQLMMRRSLSTPNESGLGLARIAAEADMSVAHELTGRTLTIMARCTVPEVVS